jgi:hypothetical protein
MASCTREQQSYTTDALFVGKTSTYFTGMVPLKYITESLPIISPFSAVYSGNDLHLLYSNREKSLLGSNYEEA